MEIKAILDKKGPAGDSPPGFHVFPVSTPRKNEWIPSVFLGRSTYRVEETADRTLEHSRMKIRVLVKKMAPYPSMTASD